MYDAPKLSQVGKGYKPNGLLVLEAALPGALRTDSSLAWEPAQLTPAATLEAGPPTCLVAEE